jgi:hypothetical protein
MEGFRCEGRAGVPVADIYRDPGCAIDRVGWGDG